MDVNLTPRWVGFLGEHGLVAVHWSSLGALNAKDEELLEAAIRGEYVLLTHDQDMGTLLALKQTTQPSVVLLRTSDLRPEVVGPKLVSILNDLREDLQAGALVVVEDERIRLRRLPN